MVCFDKNFMICQTSDVELTLDCTSQLEPFALVLGEVITSNTQFLLYVERQMISEAKSFIDLILTLLELILILTLCYPKQLLSILYFFQYYIFHIDKIQPNKFPVIDKFYKPSQFIELKYFVFHSI